jgi:hypothetical protein
MLRLPLEKISATDQLATLFNAYLDGLTLMATVLLPRHTMHECRQAFGPDKSDKDVSKSMRSQARMYYELTVLNHSLHGIHQNVVKAVQLLEHFFATYNGDLQHYAVDNRVASIRKYGSEDNSDWYRDDESNENEERKVVYKTDAASLTYYTLDHELGAFFHGHETVGEYIGTSAPDDFAPYTHVVAGQSDNSLLKLNDFFGGAGVDFMYYPPDADGNRTPVPLADQIEDEINQDIRNARLVEVFNGVLTLGTGAAQLYERLPADSVDEYRTLLGVLTCMLEVTPVGN